MLYIIAYTVGLISSKLNMNITVYVQPPGVSDERLSCDHLLLPMRPLSTQERARESEISRAHPHQSRGRRTVRGPAGWRGRCRGRIQTVAGILVTVPSEETLCLRLTFCVRTSSVRIVMTRLYPLSILQRSICLI